MRLSFQGTGVQVSSAGDMPGIVTEFQLHQNYPNPFNLSIVIVFSLPEQAHVKLEAFNVYGQLLATLVDDVRQFGMHEVTFDTQVLGSGLYLYRLKSGRTMITKKCCS